MKVVFTSPGGESYSSRRDFAVGSELRSSSGEGKATIKTISMNRSLLITAVNKMVLLPISNFLHLTSCIFLAVVLKKSPSHNINPQC